jgi:hypothetical protein
MDLIQAATDITIATFGGGIGSGDAAAMIPAAFDAAFKAVWTAYMGAGKVPAEKQETM